MFKVILLKAVTNIVSLFVRFVFSDYTLLLV